MYFAVITFTTVGYGDLHAYNVAEAAFITVYMFAALGITAYFVGTSVLLVVEAERRTGEYRERLLLLDEYSTTHDIPKVRSCMQDIKAEAAKNPVYLTD